MLAIDESSRDFQRVSINFNGLFVTLEGTDESNKFQ